MVEAESGTTGGEEFGKFLLRREAGRGGMGAVYEAFDRERGERVALKILPRFMSEKKDILDRFMREARAMAHLNHAHIAAFRELGEIQGSYFLAMEYIEGSSLRRHFRELPISETEACRIIRQIADAIQYAHSSEYGIIHRDLQPKNIIVRPDGRVALIDFGLSKIVNEASITITGSQFGTPAYMAPEQFGDAARVDHRSDLWSIGAIFYELLTGRKPVEGETVVSIMRHLNRPDFKIVPPGELNPAISERTSRILARLLAKSPGDRYGSAAQLLADLDGHEATPSAHTYEPGGSYRIGDRVEHPVLKDAGWVIHKNKSNEADPFTWISIDWDRSGVRKQISDVKEIPATVGPRILCGSCGQKTPKRLLYCITCGAEREELQIPSWRTGWAAAAAAGILIAVAGWVWLGRPSGRPPPVVPGAESRRGFQERGFDIQGDIVSELSKRGIQAERAKGFGTAKVYRTLDRGYMLWGLTMTDYQRLLLSPRILDRLKELEGQFFLLVEPKEGDDILVIPNSLLALAAFSDASDGRMYIKLAHIDGQWYLRGVHQRMDISPFVNAFEQIRK